MRRLSILSGLALVASLVAVMGSAPAAHASLGSSKTYVGGNRIDEGPNPSLAGQLVRVRVVVADDSDSCNNFPHSCDNPLGRVDLYDGTFKIDSTTLVPEDSDCSFAFCESVALFEEYFATGGDHVITAKYVPGNFDPSEASYTQNVQKIPTRTTLTQSKPTTVAGEPVTFTATTQSVFAIPTGTALVPAQMMFIVDGTEYPVNAAGDPARGTLTLSDLSGGNHLITARYLGNDTFAFSEDISGTHTVTQGGSTTTLSSSVNPSVLDQTVTFTATVAPAAPATGTPSGTVTFMDGSATLGTGTLSAGQATFSTSSLTLGHRAITATYGATTSYGASTSNTVDQVVNQKQSATVLSSSPNPSVLGNPVTLTAVVSPAAPATGTATGTVTFMEGPTTLGTAMLSGGQATLTTAALGVGHHPISAAYGGDPAFLASTSNTVDQVVNRRPSTTTLSSSSNPSRFGSSVTLTAAATGAGGAPTGTVTFYDGLTALATVPLGNGVATFTTSGLTPGSHALSAVYSGDPVFDVSTGTLTQTVTCTDVTTNVAGSYTVASGQGVCFSGVTVGGTLTVQPGGAVSLTNAKVTGGLTADGATAFRLCDSSVGGGVTVRTATGRVVIGEPLAGCAGNRLSSSLTLTNNKGGAVIGGNTIGGTLSCSGNVPAPTSGGPNTVTGARTGQCSAI
jgi:Big-like domain-containing protein